MAWDMLPQMETWQSKAVVYQENPALCTWVLRGGEGEGERQKEKGRGQLSAPAAQPGPWCLPGPGLSWAWEPPLLMLRTGYERREAALSSPAVVMATLR